MCFMTRIWWSAGPKCRRRFPKTWEASVVTLTLAVHPYIEAFIAPGRWTRQRLLVYGACTLTATASVTCNVTVSPGFISFRFCTAGPTLTLRTVPFAPFKVTTRVL